MWEADIAEAELNFQHNTPKTIQGEVSDRLLANFTSVYTILWDANRAKKWEREYFCVYCLAHLILDIYFQTMNEKLRPVYVYEAARSISHIQNPIVCSYNLRQQEVCQVLPYPVNG